MMKNHGQDFFKWGDQARAVHAGEFPGPGIVITRVGTSDLEALEEAVRPGVKLVYIATPCNPLLRLTDIRAAAEIAHKAGAQLAVDSTFAASVAAKPLSLGADYVIHSLTKYIGGHGDAQHELAKRQMKNFSGMITFQTPEGRETARRLADKLRIVHYAVSLAACCTCRFLCLISLKKGIKTTIYGLREPLVR
jgi:cystathionine beta-lyase/cystathionine gamma-synthase